MPYHCVRWRGADSIGKIVIELIVYVGPRPRNMSKANKIGVEMRPKNLGSVKISRPTVAPFKGITKPMGSYINTFVLSVWLMVNTSIILKKIVPIKIKQKTSKQLPIIRMGQLH